MGPELFSSVEPENPQVEIPGKGHPRQIGQHQPERAAVQGGKLQGGEENEAPQQHQPEKGHQIQPQVEKENGPQKVKPQLNAVERQGPLDLFFRALGPDH